MTVSREGAHGTGVESSSRSRSQKEGDSQASCVTSLRDLRRQRTQPLVEAGLARDVREQVAQPALGQAQEAPLLGTVEEDLRDREADQLGVGDPWPPAGPRRLGRRSSTST